MSKLAPARIAGLMMGVWFLALSVGSYLAGMAASVYETMPLTTLFTGVTLTAVVAGVVLVLLIRPIRRMLEREGVDQHLADVIVLVGRDRPHAHVLGHPQRRGIPHRRERAHLLHAGCLKAHSTISRTGSVA